MDLTHALLTILLILLVLVGVGLVVALGLAISAILELYALARTVRKEVSAAGGLVRGALESLAGGATKGLGILNIIKGKKKPTTRRKA